MARKEVAERRAEQLYDLLSNGDKDSRSIIDETGWAHYQFLKAVQKLRDILAANGDVISVVAEPNGPRQPWLYGLRAGQSIVDAERSRWAPNRLQDAERRIMTIGHVLEVAVNATDGRTVEGKKARIYHLHIKRAQEEVALIGAQ